MGLCSSVRYRAEMARYAAMRRGMVWYETVTVWDWVGEDRTGEDERGRYGMGWDGIRIGED